MNSRKNRPQRKRKSHWGRKLLIFLISLLVVLGLIGTGAVMLERYIVKNETTKILQHTGLSTALSTATSKSVPAASPTETAKQLNDYATTIEQKAGGLIDSTKATVNGSTVTYNVASSKINRFTVAALVAANGDSIEKIANQALSAMTESGTANPEVVINLTNDKGQVIKTLTYTK
ncbi:hypothetical protein [Lactococcus fujiensis]|uniref:hypothetical protein n=1 Tax=Lactococcus fujiensis TaxID=610251 RepID=UPI000BDF39F6|nr:hypothetical protein [Lactococcus fujiensis]